MGLKAKQVQEIMQQKDELGFHPRQCWEILVNLKEQSAFLVPAAKTKINLPQQQQQMKIRPTESVKAIL